MPTSSPNLSGAGGAGEVSQPPPPYSNNAPITAREQALIELNATLLARIKALEKTQGTRIREEETGSDSSEPPEQVTIVVGADSVKKTFHFDRKLITGASSFFKAAFEARIFNSESDSLRLENVDEKTFGVFNAWLHTGDISSTNNPNTIDLLAMNKLWVLADRFLLPKLQNQIIDEACKALAEPRTEVKGLVEATNSISQRKTSSVCFDHMLFQYWVFGIDSDTFCEEVLKLSVTASHYIASILKTSVQLLKSHTPLRESLWPLNPAQFYKKIDEGDGGASD